MLANIANSCCCCCCFFAQFQNDIRSRSEESEYLRESLNRTRDRLNQEKRLNTAIKSKKVSEILAL